LNEEKEGEGAALEPAGKEFESTAKSLVDETDALLRNAGHPGDDTINQFTRFYNKAVQNSTSNKAVIGRYVKPGDLAPYESYPSVGNRLNASYIDLKEPYLSQWNKFAGNSPNAWRTFINKPFLQETANAGKTVYLSTPPDLIGATSTTQWEIDILVNEFGYSLPVLDPVTGLWIMLP